MNIRAYKVVFPDGGVHFEWKRHDGKEDNIYNNIRTLATGVKKRIDWYLRTDNHQQMSIDLFPFHEIECPLGLLPKQCLPLSPEEKQEFWKYYNSP